MDRRAYIHFTCGNQAAIGVPGDARDFDVVTFVELLLLWGREHDGVTRGVVADELLTGLMDSVVLDRGSAFEEHVVVGSKHFWKDLVKPRVLCA
jgi:hypothetical protein